MMINNYPRQKCLMLKFDYRVRGDRLFLLLVLASWNKEPVPLK